MVIVDAQCTDVDLTHAYTLAAAVLDPEVPVITLAELGVLRGVTRRAGAIVVTLTPTYTGCPATAAIQLLVETALLDAGITNARVETVLSPAWTTDDITDSGRAKLRAYGIAPPNKTSPGELFTNDTIECPQCGSSRTTKLSEFGSTACKALWRCEDCREPFDYFKCHR
jgi:ring-1,2-phenylacetyl-CoA epoxidase subunit PaaD